MLLKLLPFSPFDAPRTERLLILEDRLRRQSHGKMALRDYVAWLEEAGIKIPASRRTLHEDLRRYAAFCDDVKYGESSKLLELDNRATRDAVAWFMGQAWVDSPLKPYLVSSVARCLLLAMTLEAEVNFYYRKLRKPGEPWQPNPYWCIPWRLRPGADSGYMDMLLPSGQLIPMNLSRISAHMAFTGKTRQDYPPPLPAKMARLAVKSEDRQLIERLRGQFKGLQESGKKQLVVELDDALSVMTSELLCAHLNRTHSPRRELPAVQQCGNAEISYEVLE